MSKINLTDEEKIELLKAVNAGLEPSPDLLPKLFPGTAEKFDVQALDRAKIPTLEYAGKRSKAAILAEAGAGIGAAPLQVVRTFGNVKKDEWQNLIVQGDNLQFLKTCYRNEDPLIKDKVKGKVKLIYIDPPFATESDFESSEGVLSYSDKVKTSEFIESIRSRLIFLKDLLSEDGSIYLHIDERMSHYIKVIFDEVFDRSNFVNEIIWKRKFGSAGQTKQYGVSYDQIYLYSKTSSYYFQPQKTIDSEHVQEYIKNRFTRSDETGPHKGRKWMPYPLANPGNPTPGLVYKYKGYSAPPKGWRMVVEKLAKLDSEGRIYFPSSVNERLQEKKFLDEYEGQPIGNLWTDIHVINSQAYEAIDYPTQKPEALIQRILEASSEKDDLVVDIFGGSGTTVAVAEKLGRRWITCDFGKHSIYTMQKRMLRIGESKALVDEKNSKEEIIIKKGDKFGHETKSFSVVSAGAYDFSHVMALGNPEHKDTYIAFVLGLFQLGRDEDKAKKFKLTNIYADKNGSPVEVYPVWDEYYLKEVRIDEEYLKGIITQAGGRLQGEYHIITPEHCTNIGETRMKNAEGKDVVFKFLTFPYKVLEDVSRHLELHEQPASQGAVNELITSTAFYFNEDVEIELKREGAGLKLTKFETKILNKEGNRFPGFEGLAMLLIDVDHEKGKPFDMDKTIFAKEVDEDGSFKIEDITGKNIAVIGIDKHGNESKPFILK